MTDNIGTVFVAVVPSTKGFRAATQKAIKAQVDAATKAAKGTPPIGVPTAAQTRAAERHAQSMAQRQTRFNAEQRRKAKAFNDQMAAKEAAERRKQSQHNAEQRRKAKAFNESMAAKEAAERRKQSRHNAQQRRDAANHRQRMADAQARAQRADQTHQRRMQDAQARADRTRATSAASQRRLDQAHQQRMANAQARQAVQQRIANQRLIQTTANAQAAQARAARAQALAAGGAGGGGGSRGRVSRWLDSQFGPDRLMADELGRKLSNAGRRMTFSGSGLALAGIGAAGYLAAKFESAIGRVGAIFGDEVYESAQRMEGLREKAIAVAETRPFTNRDVAAGMENLARAGLSYQAVLKTIEPTTDLAIAGQLELADAGNILAASLNTFYQGNPAKVGTVIDSISKASNLSNTNIEKMALAFTYASANANALGFDVAETASLISLLANKGITGSKAGTQLRSAFGNLIPNVQKNQELLKKYNVELTDAEGNLKSLPKIAAEYKQAVKGMTQVERERFLNQVFGKYGGIMGRIFAEGPEAIRERLKAVRNAEGYGKELAERSLSPLERTAVQTRSQLENLFTAIGQAITPYLIGVLEALGNAFSQLSKVDPKILTLIAASMAGLAAAGPILWATGGTIAALGAIGKAFRFIGISGKGLKGAGKNLLALLNPLKWGRNLPGFLGSIGKGFLNILKKGGITTAIIGIAEGLFEGFGDTLALRAEKEVLTVREAFRRARGEEWLERGFVSDLTKSMLDPSIPQQLLRFFGAAFDNVTEIFNLFVEGLFKPIGAGWGGNIATAMSDSLSGGVGDYVAPVGDQFQSLLARITATVEKITRTIKEIGLSIGAVMNDIVASFNELPFIGDEVTAEAARNRARDLRNELDAMKRELTPETAALEIFAEFKVLPPEDKKTIDRGIRRILANYEGGGPQAARKVYKLLTRVGIVPEVKDPQSLSGEAKREYLSKIESILQALGKGVPKGKYATRVPVEPVPDVSGLPASQAEKSLENYYKELERKAKRAVRLDIPLVITPTDGRRGKVEIDAEKFVKTGDLQIEVPVAPKLTEPKGSKQGVTAADALERYKRKMEAGARTAIELNVPLVIKPEGKKPVQIDPQKYLDTGEVVEVDVPVNATPNVTVGPPTGLPGWSPQRPLGPNPLAPGTTGGLGTPGNPFVTAPSIQINPTYTVAEGATSLDSVLPELEGEKSVTVNVSSPGATDTRTKLEDIVTQAAAADDASPTVSTSAPGAPEAAAQLDGVTSAASRIPPSKQVVVSVALDFASFGAAQQAIANLQPASLAPAPLAGEGGEASPVPAEGPQARAPGDGGGGGGGGKKGIKGLSDLLAAIAYWTKALQDEGVKNIKAGLDAIKNAFKKNKWGDKAKEEFDKQFGKLKDAARKRMNELKEVYTQITADLSQSERSFQARFTRRFDSGQWKQAIQDLGDTAFLADIDKKRKRELRKFIKSQSGEWKKLARRLARIEDIDQYRKDAAQRVRDDLSFSGIRSASRLKRELERSVKDAGIALEGAKTLAARGASPILLRRIFELPPSDSARLIKSLLALPEAEFQQLNQLTKTYEKTAKDFGQYGSVAAFDKAGKYIGEKFADSFGLEAEKIEKRLTKIAERTEKKVAKILGVGYKEKRGKKTGLDELEGRVSGQAKNSRRKVKVQGGVRGRNADVEAMRRSGDIFNITVVGKASESDASLAKRVSREVSHRQRKRARAKARH